MIGDCVAKKHKTAVNKDNLAQHWQCHIQSHYTDNKGTNQTQIQTYFVHNPSQMRMPCPLVVSHL